MSAKSNLKGTKAARKTAFILCCICFMGCCVFLVLWFANGQSVKIRNQELAERFHSAEYSTVEETGPQHAESIALGKMQKMAELRLQNEDTVGWIYINGTEIDYPIVQYTDNEYYLNRNFWGEEDRYGAIFMDCANTEQFASEHIILYGHNMKDGAMFGRLDQYIQADYLAQNPTIEITLPDGDRISYSVFAARKVYADDPSYQATFDNASEFTAFTAVLGAKDALQLLTLSTCASGSDTTERIIVHAALF